MADRKFATWAVASAVMDENEIAWAVVPVVADMQVEAVASAEQPLAAVEVVPEGKMFHGMVHYFDCH